MHLYKIWIIIGGLNILLCTIAICLLISVLLLWLFFRSAAFSQLPGCFLFIGNIYAGSKALSLLVSAKNNKSLNMDFSVFSMVGLNVHHLCSLMLKHACLCFLIYFFSPFLFSSCYKMSQKSLLFSSEQ